MEQVHQQQQAFQQQAQQQQKAFQEMTQEVLNTYTQLFNIPLSYAQEGLRSARFPIEGYEELSVEEVSGRLGGLSPEELRRCATTRSVPSAATRSWSSSIAR